MGAVRFTIRLRTLDEYITKQHGRRRAMTPTEQGELARFADRMIEYIKDRWPVDTGTSRDRWQYFLNPTPGEMAVIVENEMFYADYVHYAGGSAEDPLWKTLIPEAFGIISAALMSAALAAVDRTERAIERQRRAGQSRRDATRAALREPPGGETRSLEDIFGELFGV